MAGFPSYGTAPGTFQQPFVPVSYIPTAIPASTSVVPGTCNWVEHSSHDGRKYYYNTVTQQTTWEKPPELKTQRELILSACPWKEFKAENGKAYYFNENTKQSVWVKPQELIEAENQADAAAASSAAASEKDMILQLGTPCTPATPCEERPPEPSAIERAMKATLASYDVNSRPAAGTPESIPIPLPPPGDAPSQPKVEQVVKPSVTMEPVNQRQAPQVPVDEVVPTYKTRGEMAEGLRRLFRDCNVPGGATWEQAVKLISSDPRYSILRSFSEKKQIFNVYKTQRLKEEREEQRLRAKQAKEDLERFLLRHPKLHSTMSYRKVDQILSDAKEWTVVPDRDRRELLDDVMQEISRREREEAKVLRKRNIKVFNEILSGMAKLTYRTTWSEAQKMLLDNTKFTSDVELQSLDKEDALICFEEHICMLEQEHDEEKERERRKQKRIQRKNREAFIVLLDELHEKKLLTSTSMWKDLYAIINRDDRFHKMLAQRGSTPLDLFKFYVEALKARYPAEKKIVKEIIKDTGYVVDLSTTFEDFAAVIEKDERSKGIDEGNLRMSFDSLLEKAHGRERERQRDDARRLRKLEQNFCDMLSSADFIGPETTWEQVRDRFSDNPAFQALSLESERIRVFKDYLISVDSAAMTDAEKSRRSRKERHRHAASGTGTSKVFKELLRSSSGNNEVGDTDRYREGSKKHAASISVSPSEVSGDRKSDGEIDETSSKRRRHKSKKSKHKKSKHHRHHKLSTERSRKDDELEEGEAADDDEDDDENNSNPDQNSRGGGDTNEGKRRHRRHNRRPRSSDPEDGEEVDSGSEGEFYDRDLKRRRR